jgi:hypothetical protein
MLKAYRRVQWPFHMSKAIFTLSRLMSPLFWASRRRIERRRRVSVDPGHRKLSLSEDVVSYVDYLGKEHSIRWDDIHRVYWNEPEYGYWGGLPYWTVTGSGTFFDIDDWWGADVKELPKWFARKLPGFDADVVEKAFKRGFFQTRTPEVLECWSRQR